MPTNTFYYIPLQNNYNLFFIKINSYIIEYSLIHKQIRIEEFIRNTNIEMSYIIILYLYIILCYCSHPVKLSIGYRGRRRC